MKGPDSLGNTAAPKGGQGDQGSDGPNGTRGLDGPQGEPGSKGEPGEQGKRGINGRKVSYYLNLDCFDLNVWNIWKHQAMHDLG